MAYSIINSSNETIIWDVTDGSQVIWTSGKLLPGEQRTERHRGSFGIADLLTIQVPQYDPSGNPNGTFGWGGVLVHKDGRVTVYGDWNFDVRRNAE
jgi:hypothetical protein